MGQVVQSQGLSGAICRACPQNKAGMGELCQRKCPCQVKTWAGFLHCLRIQLQQEQGDDADSAILMMILSSVI